MNIVSASQFKNPSGLYTRCLRTYAALPHFRQITRLEQAVCACGSEQALDVLAFRISDGRLRWRDIERLVSSVNGNRAGLDRFLSQQDEIGLSALVRASSKIIGCTDETVSYLSALCSGEAPFLRQIPCDDRLHPVLDIGDIGVGCASQHRVNVAFALDLGSTNEPSVSESVLDLIAACHDLNLRCGVLHLPDLRMRGGARSNVHPIASLVQTGRLQVLDLADSIGIDRLVLVHPEPAMFVPMKKVRVRVNRILVNVTDSPTQGIDNWFDPRKCDSALVAALGVNPRWLASGSAAEVISKLFGGKKKIYKPLPRLVVNRAWLAPRRELRARLAVGISIGSGVVDVQVRNAIAAIEGVRVVSGVRAGAAKSLLLFLAECHVIVHFDSVEKAVPDAVFGRAWSSGCVVVVVSSEPGKFKFIPALVCNEEELPIRLKELRENEASRNNYVATGRAWVESTYDQTGLREVLGVRAHSSEFPIAGIQKKALRAIGEATGENDDITLHLTTLLGDGRTRSMLDRMILRTGSISARDLVAVEVTQGAGDWNRLRRCLDKIGIEKKNGGRLPWRLNGAAALRLARILAVQNLLPDDRANALKLYREVLHTSGPKRFDPLHAKLYLDLALFLGFREEAKSGSNIFSVVPRGQHYLEADLVNPFTDGHGDLRRWLEIINQPFVSHDLLPVSLDSPGRVPFDRLSCRGAGVVDHGPLVSVVVTAWRPNDELIAAVASVVRQTWRNLEIILIDDASPGQYRPILDQVAAMDVRIRLEIQPGNGGTYQARNRALYEAKGKFFTVHDSDDWAHPSRIERQLKEMLSDPLLISSTSHALRANDRLEFLLPGYSPLRENASSLLFQTEAVRDTCGYYDASRKGADSEMLARIMRVFGLSAHRQLAEPLAFIRLSHESLSRNEFKTGWRHPSRTQYRRNYEAWHTQCEQEGVIPRIERVAHRGAAPFPQPRNFIVNRACTPNSASPTFNTLLVGDFRKAFHNHVEQALAIAGIERQAGGRVAFLHLDSFECLPLRDGVEPLHPVFQQAILDQVLVEVLISDSVEADRLLVLNPASLQFVRKERVAIQTGGVLVLVSDPSSRYSVQDIDDTVFALFGCAADWVALGSKAQADLVKAMPPARTKKSLEVTAALNLSLETLVLPSEN